MLRLIHSLAVVAFLLVPALPLVGSQGGKDKEDTLIAGMKFVKVPKGTFWMSKDYKHAQVQVEIKADFELAAYTVTQELWEAVMGNNPSYFARQGKGKDLVKDIADADLKRFPVERVSWHEVQEFLMKLNEREKGKGWLYRLPTEAEWEYACRNASTTKEDCSFDFYFDKPTNDLSSTQANFDGNEPAGKAAKGPFLGRTTKVGSYAPNKLGLFDMHGNVWQWCADLYDGNGPDRVIRGGGWDDGGGRRCRAAFRRRYAPSYRDIALGFRLARVAAGGKQ
jgi:formylglycine-generating enzyme required for sulfatase activity